MAAILLSRTSGQLDECWSPRCSKKVAQSGMRGLSITADCARQRRSRKRLDAHQDEVESGDEWHVGAVSAGSPVWLVGRLPAALVDRYQEMVSLQDTSLRVFVGNKNSIATAYRAK